MNGTYFINTPSGHEIEVNEEQREAVKRAITKGLKHIMLNGNPLNLSGISIFTEPKPRKGQWFCGFNQWHMDGDACGCYENQARATVMEIFSPDRQIEAKNRCRGQYSIQLEINNIAKAEGKGWGKLITDKRWREKTRQKLLKTGTDQWCDYKSGECACEDSYLSTRAMFDRKIS